MKTLKESILDDIETSIDKMDNNVKHIKFVKDLLSGDINKFDERVNDIKNACNPRKRIKSNRSLKEGKRYIRLPYHDNITKYGYARDVNAYKHYIEFAEPHRWDSASESVDIMIYGRDGKWTTAISNHIVLSAHGWDVEYSMVYELPEEYDFVFDLLYKEINNK